MASGKNPGVSTFEAAADRVRALNERVIESSSKAGVASLETYARMLERLAEAQEQAGRRGSDWVTAFGHAQATFTRELAEALPAVARDMGERARGAASAAGRQTRRGASAADTAARETTRAADSAAPDAARAATGDGEPPIANYDKLNVKEIDRRLARLSKADLAKVESYERGHKQRATVLKRIESLRS